MLGMQHLIDKNKKVYTMETKEMKQGNPTVTKVSTLKDGTDLYGLTLKGKIDKKTGAPMTGLQVGEYIIVQKVFKGGYKNERFEQPSFGCRVNYEGKVCSFFLNEKQHSAYEATGGEGDSVKIVPYLREYTYNNEKKTTFDFNFELVE
jgi:hypothetical protein